MNRIETIIVNSRLRSASVARYAERMVGLVRPQPGMLLLDAGCGNGAAATRLAGRFSLRVTGVDIDPRQVRRAQAAAAAIVDARFLVADATRLPFPSGAFDLVWTNKTTHHIRNWAAALGEMVRVLRPGGHLIYCDFTAPPRLARWLRRIGGDDFGWPEHGALEAVIREAGLETVHLRRRRLNYEAVWRKQEDR